MVDFIFEQVFAISSSGGRNFSNVNTKVELQDQYGGDNVFL